MTGSSPSARRNLRREVRLWLLQRLTGAVLALCVAVHLTTIILAVRGGLTAEEILDRTRGAVGWLIFYIVFAALAGIHAAIGLRTIAAELFSWRGKPADIAAFTLASVTAAVGVRAALGLYL